MSENHDHEQALLNWIAAQDNDRPEGMPPCSACAERWLEMNALSEDLGDWGARKRTELTGQDSRTGVETAKRVLGPLLAQRREATPQRVAKKPLLPWILLAASALLLVWLNRPGRESERPFLPDGVMLTPGASGWALIEPIGLAKHFDMFSWERSAYPGASYELVVHDGERYAEEGVAASPLVRIEQLDPHWTPNVELPETVFWLVIVKNAEGREVERSSGWASRSPR